MFALPSKSFSQLFAAACASLTFILAAPAQAVASENQQPTIRHMVGAKPLGQLEAASTALLVIDFQNEYFTGRMPIPDGRKALDKTRELITFADKAKIPVYHVQHVVKDKKSPVFAEGSEGWKFHPDMQPRKHDQLVTKENVSAFVGTDLDAKLKKAGIKTLIVSGLMTHACVAGAARDGAALGYQVVVASDASATRAITRDNGESIDKDSLHRASLASIEDTFGDVLTTAQITALPTR